MASVYKSNIPLKSGSGSTVLFIIDPQNDFHDGSLGIPSALEDAKRIANLIREKGDSISAIIVTLDTHQRFHIAHSMFWLNKDGEHPKPFTIISHEEVLRGDYVPARSEFKDWGIEYTKKLEANSRFKLCIWPDHCLVGTSGHAVHPEIADAIGEWERANNTTTQFILKGNNSLTEHYSAIKADVEVEGDKNTSLNSELVDTLKLFDKVLICGQALSHCVNFTTRDLAELWDPSKLTQLVLLTDASSSVPGFEKDGELFVSDMTKKGLTMSNTRSLL